MKKYYDLRPLDKLGCQYSLSFGKRSNGKTHEGLGKILDVYVATSGTGVYIRRWDVDFQQNRARTLFDNLMHNGAGKNEIPERTRGRWNTVTYVNRTWTLANRDENGEIFERDEKPFCYAIALSESEHNKSSSFPTVKTVVFDEFITDKLYLTDEFVIFVNTLSTIIRDRTDVRIYMFGNTISQYCPYFTEMGLRNARTMKPGTIDIYQYGSSEMRVAVERCADTANTKRTSSSYFAFNNPKLEMINTGAWQLALYPHCPTKILRTNIIFTYIIEYRGQLLQADVVQQKNDFFTFIHRKTSEIQDPERDVIFSLDPGAGVNRRTSILRPIDDLGKKIAWFFTAKKVFYQDNEIGEAVKAFNSESN